MIRSKNQGSPFFKSKDPEYQKYKVGGIEFEENETQPQISPNKKEKNMTTLDWIEYSNQLERALKSKDLENKKLMNHNFILFKLTQQKDVIIQKLLQEQNSFSGQGPSSYNKFRSGQRVKTDYNESQIFSQPNNANPNISNYISNNSKIYNQGYNPLIMTRDKFSRETPISNQIQQMKMQKTMLRPKSLSAFNQPTKLLFKKPANQRQSGIIQKIEENVESELQHQQKLNESLAQYFIKNQGQNL